MERSLPEYELELIFEDPVKIVDHCLSNVGEWVTTCMPQKMHYIGAKETITFCSSLALALS
jgi:hypothetical protein